MAKNVHSSKMYIEIAQFFIDIEFCLQGENEDFSHDEIQRRKLFIKQLYKFFQNFRVRKSSRKSDYTIVVENSRIVFTKDRYKKNISVVLFKHISDKKIKTFYYLNVYQFQLVLRDIIFSLVTRNDGCVMHASAIDHDGGYIFLGKSSAGKSTIVRLLKDSFLPLADDLIIIRKIYKKYYIYQTPFMEKQRWIKKENKKYEVKSIILIKKGGKTVMVELQDVSKILTFLLDQIFVVEENKKLIIQWSLKFIKTNITFYHLTFKKNKRDLEKIFLSLKKS